MSVSLFVYVLRFVPLSLLDFALHREAVLALRGDTNPAASLSDFLLIHSNENVVSDDQKSSSAWRASGAMPAAGPAPGTASVDGAAESRAETNRFNLEVQMKFQTISGWKG